MGTNFYLMTTDKELVNEYFPYHQYEDGSWDQGYDIVDTPHFGYEIHLCKRSCGWVPLFEKHEKAFTTFHQMEEFFAQHDGLEIYDEYGTQYEFDDFKQEMIEHSNREKEPVKWEYSVDSIDVTLHDGKPSLHTVRCKENEAELYLPFRHDEYMETELDARKRLGAPFYSLYRASRDYHYDRDPDYMFDWTIGDFG